jgi:hypothetical protein
MDRYATAGEYCVATCLKTSDVLVQLPLQMELFCLRHANNLFAYFYPQVYSLSTSRYRNHRPSRYTFLGVLPHLACLCPPLGNIQRFLVRVWLIFNFARDLVHYKSFSGHIILTTVNQLTNP